MSFARLMANLVDGDGDVPLSALDNVTIQDSADVVSAAPAGMVVYSTLDSLPSSSLTAGDQAYVSANNRMYISNGSGWYNVALINLSPTMSLDQSGTIQLTAESLTSTVTITAQDSDNPDAILSFSVESDGNMLATGVTVSQDSSVFTITSLTEDSGGVAGSFTLTFKTTDNINTASEDLSFSLAFSNVVDSSAETLLLLKATGDGGNNSVITYQNSSDASTDFTEAGTPQASTFSPYRSGGYSAEFDGSGDYLSADLGANIGDGDFTVECWVYIDTGRSTASRGVFQISNTSGGLQANVTTNLTVAYRNSTYSHNWVVYANSTQTNTSTASLTGQWQHVALVRSGSSTKLYIDGTSIQTISDSMNYNATRYVVVGGYYSTSYLFDGYITDFRVVKGTAVYTSDFTPPTQRLTAITNTEMLAAHLPYFGDGSTNALDITVNGDTTTQPFGPYDYEPWTADDGGSVYFDGTGDGVYTATSTDYDMSGDVTVECWVRPTAASTNNHLIWTVSNSNSDGHSAGFIRKNSNPDNMAITTLGVSQGNAAGEGAMENLNVWYHCAWVKEDSPGAGDEETRFYFNGKRIYNLNGTSLWSAPTTPKLTIGKDYQTTNNAMYGYIADFHWTNSAKYTGTTYTVPTSPVSADANTVLRMSNKSDADIYDATGSFMAKPLGNCQADTGDRKFSTSSSIDFDGTGDEIQMNHAIEMFDRIGSGDFTLEAWVKSDNATKASQYFVDITGSGCRLSIFREATGGGSGPDYSWNVYDNGYEGNANSSTNTEVVQWHHIAFVKRSSVIYVYINGTEEYNFANTMDYSGTTEFNIGGAAPSRSFDNYFQGWMQDIRLSIGARYTGNFTPPTSEYDL